MTDDMHALIDLAYHFFVLKVWDTKQYLPLTLHKGTMESDLFPSPNALWDHKKETDHYTKLASS